MKKCILFGGLYKDEFIFSKDRHDFTTSYDTKVFIDGGQYAYVRTGGENLSERSTGYAIVAGFDFVDVLNNVIESPLNIQEIVFKKALNKTEVKFYEEQKYIWRSYGKDGKEPVTYNFLKDLTTSHLKNILKTQSSISLDYKSKIKKILKKRSAKIKTQI